MFRIALQSLQRSYQILQRSYQEQTVSARSFSKSADQFELPARRSIQSIRTTEDMKVTLRMPELRQAIQSGNIGRAIDVIDDRKQMRQGIVRFFEDGPSDLHLHIDAPELNLLLSAKKTLNGGHAFSAIYPAWLAQPYLWIPLHHFISAAQSTDSDFFAHAKTHLPTSVADQYLILKAAMISSDTTFAAQLIHLLKWDEAGKLLASELPVANRQKINQAINDVEAH